MQTLKKIDDSLWLIVVAILILAVGFLFKGPSFEPSELDLIVWGILSGTMYALTNANDKRAVDGRKAIRVEEGATIDEKAIYPNEIDYMAIGGIFAVVLTWGSLVILYSFFGPKANYPFGNITSDLITAFGLKFPVASLPGVSQLAVALNYTIPPIFGDGIPYAFVLTGLFTILLTLSTFKIFQSAGLDYYARWLACQMVASLLGGHFLFNEKIPLVVAIIIGVLIVFFILTSIWKPKSIQKTGNPRAWGVVFLISAFFRDLFVRGALLGFDNPRKIFTSFCFRAEYFSVFLLIPLGILFFRTVSNTHNQARKTDNKPTVETKPFKKISLPFATAFILVLVFTLQTPVVANSLSLGPLSLQIGNILAVSFVGLFYKTEGTRPSLAGRFTETFFRNESGFKKYYYLISYFLFLLTAIYWIYYSFTNKV